MAVSKVIAANRLSREIISLEEQLHKLNADHQDKLKHLNYEHDKRVTKINNMYRSKNEIQTNQIELENENYNHDLSLTDQNQKHEADTKRLNNELEQLKIENEGELERLKIEQQAKEALAAQKVISESLQNKKEQQMLKEQQDKEIKEAKEAAEKKAREEEEAAALKLTKAKEKQDKEIKEAKEAANRDIKERNRVMKVFAGFKKALEKNALKKEEEIKKLKDVLGKYNSNYINFIVSKIDNDTDNDNISKLRNLKSADLIYNNLMSFNDIINKGTITGIEQLGNIIYNILNNNLIGDETLVTNSETTLGKLKKGINQLGLIERKTLNDIENIIKVFYQTKDIVFPARIIMNFGTFYQPSSTVDTSGVNTNFNRSVTISKKNSNEYEKTITNILPNTNIRSLGPDDDKIKDDKYGQYFLVQNTNELKYDIDSDISYILNPPSDTNNEIPHFVYSAYGFSGSGKTRTLIESANKNSVLKKITTKLARLHQKQRGNSGISIKYRIYDYYGELLNYKGNAGCGVLSRDEDTIGDRTIINFYNASKDTNDNSFKQCDDLNTRQIETDIKDFERLRKTNLFPDERSAMRIRSTPNNDESSRSHLFVDIDFYMNEETTHNNVRKGRVTILDMAGSENVDSIQNSYFLKFDTDYDTTEFNIKMTELSTYINKTRGLGATKSQLTNSSMILNGTVKRNYIDNLNNFNVTKIKLKDTPKPGSFIIKETWTHLKDKLEKDEQNSRINYVEMGNFIKNYNYYNYLIMLDPVLKLRNTLFTIFTESTLAENQCKSINTHTNVESVRSTGQDTSIRRGVTSSHRGVTSSRRGVTSGRVTNRFGSEIPTTNLSFQEKLTGDEKDYVID